VASTPQVCFFGAECRTSASPSGTGWSAGRLAAEVAADTSTLQWSSARHPPKICRDSDGVEGEITGILRRLCFAGECKSTKISDVSLVPPLGGFVDRFSADFEYGVRLSINHDEHIQQMEGTGQGPGVFSAVLYRGERKRGLVKSEQGQFRLYNRKFDVGTLLSGELIVAERGEMKFRRMRTVPLNC
jgi:hypothetical protein